MYTEADLGGSPVVRNLPPFIPNIYETTVYPEIKLYIILAVRNSDIVSYSIVYFNEPRNFVLSSLVPSCPSAL